MSVTDPKTLITNYTVDGLDNQKQLVSPDTGTTNGTYDAAGNLKTSTDARGKVSTYAYDALNRVIGITFSDTTPAIAFIYDDITLGNFGKGRLTKFTDGTGNTTFKYDLLGRPIQKTQTTGTIIKTVSYAYDSLGRMNSITYPSGKVLTYGFDGQGRINSEALNGVNLVSAITYQPFGPAKSWLWSGGPVQTRAFDLDGRQTSYPYTGAGTVNLTYDLGNRIKNLSGTLAKAYGYDKLDRLATYSNQVYAYDATGNRSSHTVGATTYGYTYPATSHRLASFTGPTARSYTYDAAGNILTTGSGFTFSYDARGRMTNITAGSVNQYGINALGQRLTKAGTGYTGTLRFVYGDDGKLLGEYDNTGALITEHVYLQDTPIAVIKAAGAYLIQADHLNTPRAILGASNALVWKWDSDAFGGTAANENPSVLGIFNYNPRFPGQYYDKESALHYNYWRDSYNPKTGRYFQSDPIGLAGGINTYSYVDGNPVSFSDPLGLNPATAIGAGVGSFVMPGPGTVVGAVIGTAVGVGIGNLIFNKPGPLDSAGGAEHTSGARPSTGDKHDVGRGRVKTDRGGEKGDDARDLPRRRPKGWTGPWPPTPKTPEACEK